MKPARGPLEAELPADRHGFHPLAAGVRDASGVSLHSDFRADSSALRDIMVGVAGASPRCMSLVT